MMVLHFGSSYALSAFLSMCWGMLFGHRALILDVVVQLPDKSEHLSASIATVDEQVGTSCVSGSITDEVNVSTLQFLCITISA